MKKIVLIGLISMLALVPAAFSAPKQPSGTIAGPNEAAPYTFGDAVSFTTTTANLKGNQWPMVLVSCYSVVDDELLYGQLAPPVADSNDEVFYLGGGSSEWHTDRDDANCTATLYAYGGKPYVVQLAEPVAFFAEG